MGVIKYNNISKEDFNYVVTNFNNKYKAFIIHKFLRNSERDYIVIGKIKEDKLTVLDDNQFCNWMLMCNDISMNYKKPLVNKEGIFNYFLFHDISEQVLFTLEGYDLLTNKFKYTNFIINRTVSMGIIKSDGEFLYNRFSNCNKNVNFFDLNYLHDNYLFTKEELNRLSKVNFLYYLRENLFKINNLSKQDSRFSQSIGLQENIVDKINFIMEYLVLHDINHKNKYVKRNRR